MVGQKLVSRSELAVILGLSPNRVSEIRVMGVIQAVSSNPWTFDAIECSRAYVQYRRDKATERAQSGDLEELQSKLRKYRSNLAKDENRLGKLKDEALPIKDLEGAYNRFFRQIALNELELLPERITNQVVLTKNVAECYEAIDNVVRTALTKLAATEFDEEGYAS
jgi:phage terminase Nu1 subunit (DNA packaging protein)